MVPLLFLLSKMLWIPQREATGSDPTTCIFTTFLQKLDAIWR